MPPTFCESFCYFLIRSRNSPTNQPEHENLSENRYAILCSIDLYTAPTPAFSTPVSSRITTATDISSYSTPTSTTTTSSMSLQSPCTTSNAQVNQNIEPSHHQSLLHSLHHVDTYPTKTIIPFCHRNTSLHSIRALTARV